VGDLRFLDMESSVSTIIKAPVDVVWPHLLEQAKWMREFRIETVSGEHNREGELKAVMHFEPGFEDFFFKTLKIVPLRRFVYKAFTESRNGEYGFTGIEILSLEGADGGTRVSFEAYLEIQSTRMSQERLSNFVREAKEEGVGMWGRNFQRLNELATNRLSV
jgi:hypothetical protein